MRYIFAIMTLILAVAIAGPLSADNKATTGGVYLTANDFSRGLLTNEGVRSSKYDMLLHDSIFGKPYIEVVVNGKATRYMKDEIWGFRDFDGKSYRFVNKDAYEVREAGRLVIYTFDEFVVGRKGKTAPTYFFSAGAAGSVTALTTDNLKAAFPSNHRFHDYLDMMPGSVTDYDKFHKTFRVNHLLTSSES